MARIVTLEFLRSVVRPWSLLSGIGFSHQFVLDLVLASQGSGFNTMYQSKEGEEEEMTKRSVARKRGEDCLTDTKSQQRG
ncbi:BQ5605_C009g05711 [Microbotryum silenes-dioicae]|uniref:BQ5605_C009g05711 protein n=1 Tax=Microbotryum silenes-dioicae TaxID=796604 RepID=A0A2X0MI30_9BASI|nr:BQ5605_C009g05711 [Microbotryum silenes-dioicae]